jgi:oligoendopeptidase F
MTTTIYVQGKWSLDDLFPGFDTPELEQGFRDLEKRVSDFEQVRSKLSAEMAPTQFMEILGQYEQAVRRLSRLYAFGYLGFTEDTQDPQAQTFFARVQQLAAEFDNRTMFLKLWWKGLDDGAAEKLMAVAGDDRYWLEALRLERPHTLSEAEEKVINVKNVNGAAALVNLYDSITNRYTYRIEDDGRVRELTREELMDYVRKPDPALRAAAYQELYRVFRQDAPILAQVYQYRVRDWRSENVGLRRYASPIATRNLSNNIPDPVVDTLLGVCRENARLFQRYFRLKARWLGVDRLRRYDIYAPTSKSERTYSYADGVELVLKSFSQFDEEVGNLARRVLDERHLDSEVRKGKMSGAFCLSSEPALTPWILSSYKGRPDDVMTLAHELGHAIHGLLAAHHSILVSDPSLPLAETASTFSEMLVMDRLMEIEKDPLVQRDLLFREIDDAYATIMRQAYFALFERAGHETVHHGGGLEELTAAYRQNLEEQFGDSVDLTEDFHIEWTAIPHFFQQPFYVYAYAFGQLLVLALYQQYRKEGVSFKPRYLGILRAGGSDAPMRVLDAAGIDVRQGSFWQGGFNVLQAGLERLEAIEIPAKA